MNWPVCIGVTFNFVVLTRLQTTRNRFCFKSRTRNKSDQIIQFCFVGQGNYHKYNRTNNNEDVGGWKWILKKASSKWITDKYLVTNTWLSQYHIGLSQTRWKERKVQKYVKLWKEERCRKNAGKRGLQEVPMAQTLCHGTIYKLFSISNRLKPFR